MIRHNISCLKAISGNIFGVSLVTCPTVVSWNEINLWKGCLLIKDPCSFKFELRVYENVSDSVINGHKIELLLSLV